MFVVLYRWRVKPNLENRFIESWTEITAHLREKYGSLGSRLHRGSDGLWYGYAQWKSADQREQVFASDLGEISEAYRQMQESIAESFPEISLDVAADFLVLPEKNKKFLPRLPTSKKTLYYSLN